MASRVSIHVGAPKSGTTYLQNLLSANVDALGILGVLYPKAHSDHVFLAERARRGGHDSAWRRLSKQIRRWPGPVVLSSEWFSLLEPDRVAQFLEDLATPQVDVVFTARSYIATAPAAWQQTLKSGYSSSLGDFVRGMDTPGSGESWDRWGWRTMDAARVLPRWETSVPQRRIHLVTVPPAGAPRRELFRRFAQACGFDPSTCTQEPKATNESIGAEGARLMQLLGGELQRAVGGPRKHDWRMLRKWIRVYLNEDLIASRGGSPIQVGAQERELLAAHAARSVNELRGKGYDIVGSLDDLLDDASKPGAVKPEDVTDVALLELTLQLLPPMLARLRQEGERAERAERQLRGRS